jgi:hypothetical protein
VERVRAENRLLVARRVDAIPPGVSKHSRAMRLYSIRNQVGRLCGRLAQTQRSVEGLLIVVHDTRELFRWVDAEVEAWEKIEAALDAGEPLTGFLYPSGA